MTTSGVDPNLLGRLRLGERSAAVSQAEGVEGAGAGVDPGAGLDRTLSPDSLTYQIKSGRHWYRRQYPDRDRAHKLAKAAERRGEIVRPSTCDHCGQARKLDAHHDDYSQPLAVRWLCRACHTHIHPKTQKNVGPVWGWSLQADRADMAAAMQAVRR